uniref:Uncharacterized protein n=1 Tax=Davidia involucrata TaxID=16924 RepID=A0A5B7BEA1_DAVIN
MSWLLNSMQPHIGQGYLFLATAHAIWTVVAQTYSQIGNDAQVYELRNKVHETKQKDMTISAYYAELNRLWQELDYYQDFQADCASDSVKFQKLIEKERV